MTIRRSIVLGRIFLAVGTGYLLIFGIAVGLTSGAAFAIILTLFLPVFTVVGSMGGLMAFTNDRLKGVFEYLIAYGVSPRRLFANLLVSTLVLVTIVLGISLAVVMGVYVADGGTVSADLAVSLALYSIPMSYASGAFAAAIGMFWTSLSSPRTGMNSPIGLMPLIGIAPSLIALAGAVAANTAYGPSAAYIVLGVAVVSVVALVLVLLRLMERLMRRERLLSPA
ncbi:MAG TPA: hypothetical protein VEY12_00185 [Thermoplasmata archaeon]|nr:hypothetical protein [Thermoplasmata archaeon]